MTTIFYPEPFYSAKKVKSILENSDIFLNEKSISSDRAIELIGMGLLREKLTFSGPTCEFDTKEGKLSIRMQQNE